MRGEVCLRCQSARGRPAMAVSVQPPARSPDGPSHEVPDCGTGLGEAGAPPSLPPSIHPSMGLRLLELSRWTRQMAGAG